MVGDKSLNARRREVTLKSKRKQVQLQEQQDKTLSYWATHQATSGATPQPRVYPENVRGQMCPAGSALQHPAAGLLLKYATEGCPAKTGKNWTLEQFNAAVAQGPHASALLPEARDQHLCEVEEKVAKGQAQIIDWKELRRNLPKNLKLSPIAMIPHKSRT